MLLPRPNLNLILAPMEGVTDAPMRELLTRSGEFNFCVAEFLRISQATLPDRVFLKHVPELARGGRTASGCPVIVQLLGGNAELLAQSAAQAVRLGALGVDLNFGCPAPTVNRHDGGATLLKYPARIEAIVSAVRKSVRADVSVSAKLRLGWDSKESVFENSLRAQNGGATWITIHARTKVQGYAPPADWEIVGKVARTLQIPVIVNGDLWSIQDIQMAMDTTGSNSFMLGRGALADPTLVHALRVKIETAPSWPDLVSSFINISSAYGYGSNYLVRRIKQWLRMASLTGKFLNWELLKTQQSLEQVIAVLK